jgi:hypothetical protein
MCVMLCANSHVFQWLDLDVALACRHALQLSPACLGDPLNGAEATECLDDAAVQKLARGPMLRQPARRKPAEAGEGFRGGSSHEWKNPLNTLTKALSRLLVFVGWRR